jgi:hypothetical protein
LSGRRTGGTSLSCRTDGCPAYGPPSSAGAGRHGCSSAFRYRDLAPHDRSGAHTTFPAVARPLSAAPRATVVTARDPGAPPPQPLGADRRHHPCAIRHRSSRDLPGSALIGNGGIALSTSVSRVFQPGEMVATSAVAVSPVPPGLSGLHPGCPCPETGTDHGSDTGGPTRRRGLDPPCE